MEKKEIKIKFVDFWRHWNPNDNFIVNILKKRYNVEISDEPDYIFFSNFNEFFDHMDYNKCVKIFYTQENICPDFNFCDYGIGFEYIDYLDRYIRFPIYFIEERYGDSWRRMLLKHIFNEKESKQLLKRKFCSFVVSNNKSDKIRREIFEKLCQYKMVDSGGRYLNNIGMPDGVSDKLEFDLKHKFSICFENSTHSGYSTEKLIESFAAKTIPIYWGDPHITSIFNEKAFVNVGAYASVEEAVARIIEIDQNDELYLDMLSKPALNSGYEDVWNQKQQELKAFLYNILEQSYEDAFRRNLVFWGAVYANRYKKMRKCFFVFYRNIFSEIISVGYKKLKDTIKEFYVKHL